MVVCTPLVLMHTVPRHTPLGSRTRLLRIRRQVSAGGEVDRSGLDIENDVPQIGCFAQGVRDGDIRAISRTIVRGDNNSRLRGRNFAGFASFQPITGCSSGFCRRKQPIL